MVTISVIYFITLYSYIIGIIVIISDLMDSKSCEGVLSRTRVTYGLCKVTVLFLQKLHMFTTQEIAAYLIIGIKNITTQTSLQFEVFLKRKIEI